GKLGLPMAVGTVTGSINVHPMSKLALKILDIQSPDELAQVIVAVSLSHHLGALKALVTDGIQKGHMALHSRSVAISAGATGELVDMIAKKLVETKDIRVSNAKQLLKDYKK